MRQKERTKKMSEFNETGVSVPKMHKTGINVIEIHKIQTMTASNPNRDDTGSPKGLRYGDAERKRWSSQSQKKPMRDVLTNNSEEYCIQQEQQNVRSRYTATIVAKHFAEDFPQISENVLADKIVEVVNIASKKSDSPLIPKAKTITDVYDGIKSNLFDEESDVLYDEKVIANEMVVAANMAFQQMNAAILETEGIDTFETAKKAIDSKIKDLKNDSEKDIANKVIREMLNSETLSSLCGMGSDAILNIGWNEIIGIVALVAEYIETNVLPSKKDVQNALHGHNALTAAFGRLMAKAPYLNVDACFQVADAITTHRTYNEFDFFTATDDYPLAEGASMMGTQEFTSGTYYCFMDGYIHNFHDQLQASVEETADMVCAITKSFIRTIPQGKINSYANHLPPNLTLVVLRKEAPKSLAGAFAKPIKAVDGGYVYPSVVALVNQIKNVQKYCTNLPEAIYAIYDNELEDVVKDINITDGITVTECASVSDLLIKLNDKIKEDLQ